MDEEREEAGRLRLTRPVREGLRLLVDLAHAAAGVEYEHVARFAIDAAGRDQLRRAEAWITARIK